MNKFKLLIIALLVISLMAIAYPAASPPTENVQVLDIVPAQSSAIEVRTGVLTVGFSFGYLEFNQSRSFADYEYKIDNNNIFGNQNTVTAKNKLIHFNYHQAKPPDVVKLE